MRKAKVLLLLFLTVFQLISLFAPTNVLASGTCGVDLYQGRTTGCYLVSNAPQVPEEGWHCGVGTCRLLDEYRGECGRDFYTEPDGTERLTFCSWTDFGGSRLVNGYTGCPSGTQCLKGDAIGSQECSWAFENNRVGFCYGGFPTAESLRSSTLEYECVDNCGGAGVADLTGPRTPIQRISLSGAVVGDSEDGKYSCHFYDFDDTVTRAITWRIDTLSLACGVSGVATLLAGSALTGGILGGAAIDGIVGGAAAAVGNVTAGVSAIGLTDACIDAVNEFRPRIQGRVVLSNGQVACRREIDVMLNASREAAPDLEPDDTRFNLCNQITDQAQKAQCQLCESKNTNGENKGIWTAVGCIESSTSSIVRQVLTIGLSLAGGAAILLILASGFLFSTSQGDPKRTGEAKELLTSAVIGLLFIIFGVTILQFIGVTLFRLPGFGM